jgi:prepilin-type N-terminal cleavage/methylation domain-containing protein
MHRPFARVSRGLPVSGSDAGRRGFTLLELAVVVAIISIVLAVCVPLARHLIVQARASALENDLRVFTAAFQSYANEHGDWPAGDGTPGAFPDGMAAYLSSTNWQRRTPIGGNYTWDPNSLQQGSRHRAAIVISSTPDNPVTSDRVQLLEMDQKFDDGELSTGSLLLGYRNYPVFILEH